MLSLITLGVQIAVVAIVAVAALWLVIMIGLGVLMLICEFISSLFD